MASKDRGLTPIELSGFCSEIALMLGAGMPLYAGMEALEKTYEQDAHADLYHKVSETLTQTGSLRDALEETHAFPTYLVEMCGIGERTGHLEDVMQGLSAYYERESRIRQAVRSAVTYPLVLSVMMVLILMVLILKVMPVFRRVLGSMGVAMTATGSMMMNVGTVIGWVVLALVLVFALAALICVLLLKSGRREQVLAGLKKAFPPLRRLSMRLASSRAASVLAMMLSSGFPLEQALEMVPLVLPDAGAAGEIAKIREKMGEGVSFSDALTGSAMFDEIHRQMLRMGIAAGREDQVMSKIAQTYEQQVEESISGLVSIIEPTMVAALSIVIGAVLLRVKTKKHGLARGLALTLAVFAALFGGAVAAFQKIGSSSENMEEQLVLDAVRRAALTCYAVEGAYPQSLEELERGYGLAYNKDAYIVSYDAFASNIMPNIQVLRKGETQP